jgi:prevent-host-death family protein
MARVTATDAARKFADLLNRVRDRGEAFEVLRGGEIVARLVPAATTQAGPTVRTLIERLQTLDHCDPNFAADLEAVQADQHPPAEDELDT